MIQHPLPEAMPIALKDSPLVLTQEFTALIPSVVVQIASEFAPIKPVGVTAKIEADGRATGLQVMPSVDRK